VKRVEVNEYN